MKKIFLFILFFILFFSFSIHKTWAADRCDQWTFTDEKGTTLPPFYNNINKVTYSFKILDYAKDPDALYTIKECQQAAICLDIQSNVKANNGVITGSVPIIHNNDLIAEKTMFGYINNRIEVYKVGSVITDPICKYIYDWKDAPSSKRAECALTLTPNVNIQPKDELKIDGQITSTKGMKDYSINNPANRDSYSPSLEIRGEINKDFKQEINVINGNKEFSVNMAKDWPEGSYTATAKFYVIDPTDFWQPFIPVSCNISFTVPDGVIPTSTPIPTPTTPAFCGSPPCDNGSCSDRCNQCPGCPGFNTPKIPGINIPNLKPLCDQLGSQYSGKCWECQNTGGIWSAIGCLPTNLSDLLKKYIFTTGVGIAGGIAFLSFLYGAFMILTSSGNAEAIEEAKQIITSALAGLLLIIFSVLLLQVIGIQILQLPGFK